jgi:uncharacterized protein DUF732
MLKGMLIGTALVSAAALGAAALGLAAPASADTVEQQFIAVVRGGAHVTGSDARILETGNWVCWQLGPGQVAPAQVVANVEANNPDLPHLAARDFVVEASQFYCPSGDWDQYWAYGTDASGGGGGVRTARRFNSSATTSVTTSNVIATWRNRVRVSRLGQPARQRSAWWWSRTHVDVGRWWSHSSGQLLLQGPLGRTSGVGLLHRGHDLCRALGTTSTIGVVQVVEVGHVGHAMPLSR